MIKLNEVYKRSIWGNMVEVVRIKRRTGLLRKPMELLSEKPRIQGLHVPVIEIKKDKIIVKVVQSRTMEEKHYIEWMNTVNGKVYRKHLKPHDPEAEPTNAKITASVPQSSRIMKNN